MLIGGAAGAVSRELSIRADDGGLMWLETTERSGQLTVLLFEIVTTNNVFCVLVQRCR